MPTNTFTNTDTTTHTDTIILVIFFGTQHSPTVFRARVDIAPQNYVKIAVNHEVNLICTRLTVSKSEYGLM